LGQKVNPISLRLGIVKTWESRWFAGKKYADYIFEDFRIRKFIKEKLHHAGFLKLKSNGPPDGFDFGFSRPGPVLLSEKRALRSKSSRRNWRAASARKC
jgi:hypothetical protein